MDTLLPYATLLGSLRGHLVDSTTVRKVFEYQLAQFFALFVLIYQGGAKQNIPTAFWVAIIVYTLIIILRAFSPT